MNNLLPLRDEIDDRLAYNETTGIFRWKPRPEINRYVCAWNNKFAGNIAGSKCRRYGFNVISFHYIRYQAHRLAWKLYYNEDPGEMYIDHIDEQTEYYDAISNLRLATHSQILSSSHAHSTHSGNPLKRLYRGVRRNDHGNKYSARIWINNQEISLGSYDTAEEARDIRNRKAEQLHTGYTCSL